MTNSQSINEIDCKGCGLNFHATSREPKSLVPCGHSLCIECANKADNCIECKQEIKSLIPNYELIKYLQIVPTAPPAYTSTIHIEAQPLNSTTLSQTTSNNSFKLFCTRISDHFFELSIKRKSNNISFYN